MKGIGEELTALLTKRVSMALTSVGQVAKSTIAGALAQSLIGMSEQAAKAACSAAGFKFRINSKDGKGRMGTADARGDRIKVDIAKDKIVKAWVG